MTKISPPRGVDDSHPVTDCVAPIAAADTAGVLSGGGDRDGRRRSAATRRSEARAGAVGGQTGELEPDVGQLATSAQPARLGNPRKSDSDLPSARGVLRTGQDDQRRHRRSERGQLQDSVRFVLGKWQRKTDEGAVMVEPSMSAAKCRLAPLPDREAVDIVVSAEGEAHYGGLMVCGNPWVCPVCAPIIRAKRAEEVRSVAKGVLGDGGSIVFVTTTIPHDFVDDLKPMWEAISSGWRYLFSVRKWHGDSKKEAVSKLVPDVGMAGELGYIGQVRAFEVTHGGNGFHPHVHALLCFDRDLDADDEEALFGYILRRWQKRIKAKGYRSPSARHGVLIERVRTVDELGNYLTKVEGLESLQADIGMELTGVGKTAKGKNRSPWQILWSFHDTGDMADADLFRTFAKASKGRASLYISPNLRKLYLQEEEQTDEAIAAADVGGEVVAKIDGTAWKLLNSQVRSIQIRILEAAEDHRADLVGAFAEFGLVVAGYCPETEVPVFSAGGDFWACVAGLRHAHRQKSGIGLSRAS